MAKIDLDWGSLRTVLIFCGMAMVCALILAWAGFSYRQGVEQEVNKIRRQTQALKRQAEDARHERELVATHLSRYQELIALEVMGEDTQGRRLGWMENAKAAAENGQLPSLRFSLHLRKPYSSLLPMTKQEQEVFASPMDLDMGLLHEGDLLNYFELLQRLGRGLFTVESCQLTRSGPGNVLDPKLATINGRCRILWQTIAQRPEVTP